MQTLFDPEAQPLSREELATVMEDAREFLDLWKKRTLYSAGIFLLSCASVVPFFKGHPLQAYWDSVGKCLLIVSMVLLMPFVICLVIAIQVWFDLRTMRRTGQIPS